MTGAVAFYQVAGETPAAVDAVLPALLEKAVQTGQPVRVWAPTLARAQRLDEALWTYHPAAFLPHAVWQPGSDDDSVIQLVPAEDWPSLPAATKPMLAVMLAGGEELVTTLSAAGSRVMVLFGSNPAEVARSRAAWKTLKTAGVPLTYYAQQERGWARKAQENMVEPVA